MRRLVLTLLLILPLSSFAADRPNIIIDVNKNDDIGWTPLYIACENGHLEKNEAEADAPTNSACTDEQHAAMERGEIPGGKIRFVE